MFDLLYKALGVLSTLFFLFIVAVTVLTFKKAKRASRRGLLISVVMSVAVLLVYLFLINVGASWLILVGLLLGGGVIGALWSRATQVYRDETGQIYTRNTVWYLTVWAFIVTLTQLTAMFAPQSVIYSVSLLALTTGTSIGMNGSVLARIKTLTYTPAQAPRVAPLAPITVTGGEAPQFCRHCGVRLEGDAVFCTECGGQVR